MITTYLQGESNYMFQISVAFITISLDVGTTTLFNESKHFNFTTPYHFTKVTY